MITPPPPTKKPAAKAPTKASAKRNAQLAAQLKMAEAEGMELAGALEALLAAMDTAWPGEVKSSKSVQMARGWAHESFIKVRIAREARAKAWMVAKPGDTAGREVKAIFDGIITTDTGQWGGETVLKLVRLGALLAMPDMIFESRSVNVQVAHLFNTPVLVTFTTAKGE